MSVLGERIKKLRGGENEMAFGEVVNFIPVLRWKYRGVPWSLKLQGGFFLKTQKSPAFNRASLWESFQLTPPHGGDFFTDIVHHSLKDASLDFVLLQQLVVPFCVILWIVPGDVLLFLFHHGRRLFFFYHLDGNRRFTLRLFP